MNKKRKVFRVGFNGKKLAIADYIICNSFFSRARGLMFRPKSFKTPLLFVFNKPCKIAIHSFFVGGDFLAVWMLNGKIIEKRIVKPWRISVTPKGKFNFLLEIPLKKV